MDPHLSTSKPRAELLEEWRREILAEPPSWLDNVTNDGVHWHLERFRQAVRSLDLDTVAGYNPQHPELGR